MWIPREMATTLRKRGIIMEIYSIDLTSLD